MKLDYIYEAFKLVILILLQVLVFNQISVFGFATPFLYIYFLLKLPMGRNVFYVIVIGFLMGFIIDIFLNTPGINAAATTLVASLRQPFLRLFFTREEFENFVPGIYSATGPFIRFTVIMVLIHQVALFGLESFSLFNPSILLSRLFSSVILTLILVFAVDSFVFKKLISE